MFPFPNVLNFIKRSGVIPPAQVSSTEVNPRFKRLNELMEIQFTRMFPDEKKKIDEPANTFLGYISSICRSSVIIVLRKLLVHFQSEDISNILPSIIHRFPEEQKEWITEGIAKYAETKLGIEEKGKEDEFVTEYLSGKWNILQSLRTNGGKFGISITEINNFFLKVIKSKNISLNLPKRYRNPIKRNPTQRNIFKRI